MQSVPFCEHGSRLVQVDGVDEVGEMMFVGKGGRYASCRVQRDGNVPKPTARMASFP